MRLERLTRELCAGDPSSRACYTYASNSRALVESVAHRPFESRFIAYERLEPFERSCSSALAVFTQ